MLTWPGAFLQLTIYHHHACHMVQCYVHFAVFFLCVFFKYIVMDLSFSYSLALCDLQLLTYVIYFPYLIFLCVHMGATISTINRNASKKFRSDLSTMKFCIQCQSAFLKSNSNRKCMPILLRRRKNIQKEVTFTFPFLLLGHKNVLGLRLLRIKIEKTETFS